MKTEITEYLSKNGWEMGEHQMSYVLSKNKEIEIFFCSSNLTELYVHERYRGDTYLDSIETLKKLLDEIDLKYLKS